MSQHGTKKRKLDRSTEDYMYFDSYSDVTIHEEMIADKCELTRTEWAFLKTVSQ